MVFPVSKKTNIDANAADADAQVEDMPTAQEGGFRTPEPRFPKAAVDYVDSLLEIQRQRFDRESAILQAATAAENVDLRGYVSHPKSAYFLADGDRFVGTGWSELGHRRDGTAFRWMGRIGTLLLPIDMTGGGTITINGCGYTKKKFLETLTVWIDDQPVPGDMARKGFNRWIFSGAVPPTQWRPYSILRVQSAGQARLAVGMDTFASVAVCDIHLDAGQPEASKKPAE